MEKRNFADDLQHPVFELIAKAAHEIGRPAFVIGGFVRDLIMQRSCTDIDIVVDGDGIALAQRVSEIMGEGQPVTVFK